MKYILLFGVLFLFSCASTQNNKDSKRKKTFTVYGNCGMCKKTIEASLEGVSGIYWSDWGIESKELTVKFNPEAIDLNNIQKRIAAVGYDSENHRATKEVYNTLNGCCQYERP